MKKILLCMGLSALLAGCGGREKPLAEVVDEALARAERQVLLMAEKYGDREGPPAAHVGERRGRFVGFALVVQRIFSGDAVVRV